MKKREKKETTANANIVHSRHLADAEVIKAAAM